MKLDHLILGISDLDKGISDFEKFTGVRAQFAGVHPNIGTHNALMSLGDGMYLEIIAPQVPNTKLTGSFSGFEHFTELTPVGWVVSGSLSAIENELNQSSLQHTGIVPGSRKAPSGMLLSWETIFVTQENRINMNPFFIEWSPDTTHPSLSNPGGCTLVDYAVSDNKSALIKGHLKGIEPRYDIHESEKAAGTLLYRAEYAKRLHQIRVS